MKLFTASFLFSLMVFPVTLQAGFSSLLAVNFLDDTLKSIDPRTGSSTTIGAVGAGFVTDLVYHPLRKTLIAHNSEDSSNVEIDPLTGATTNLNASFGVLEGFAYDDNSNTFYTVQAAQEQLVTFDVDAKSFSVLSDLSRPGVRELAFDETRNKLFGIDDINRELVEVNPFDGTVLTIAGIQTPRATNRVLGMTYDELGDRLLGIEVSSDELVEIDRITGELTYIGGSGLNGTIALAAVTAIPEPSVFTLVPALVWAFLLRRRRFA